MYRSIITNNKKFGVAVKNRGVSGNKKQTISYVLSMENALQ